MAVERKAQGELARALSHPVRVEILETLRGRVASSAELSRVLDRSPGVIAYHASTLLRCGCLQLIEPAAGCGPADRLLGTTPGAELADRGWRSTTEAERSAIAGSALADFRARARRLLSRLRARNRRPDRAL